MALQSSEAEPSNAALDLDTYAPGDLGGMPPPGSSAGASSLRLVQGGQAHWHYGVPIFDISAYDTDEDSDVEELEPQVIVIRQRTSLEVPSGIGLDVPFTPIVNSPPPPPFPPPSRHPDDDTSQSDLYMLTRMVGSSFDTAHADAHVSSDGEFGGAGGGERGLAAGDSGPGNTCRSICSSSLSPSFAPHIAAQPHIVSPPPVIENTAPHIAAQPHVVSCISGKNIPQDYAADIHSDAQTYAVPEATLPSPPRTPRRAPSARVELTPPKAVRDMTPHIVAKGFSDTCCEQYARSQSDDRSHIAANHPSKCLGCNGADAKFTAVVPCPSIYGKDHPCHHGPFCTRCHDRLNKQTLPTCNCRALINGWEDGILLPADSEMPKASSQVITAPDMVFAVDDATRNNLRLVVEWAFSQPQLVTQDRLAYLFHDTLLSVENEIGHNNTAGFIKHFIAVELAAGHPEQRQMLNRIFRTDIL